MQFWLIVCTGYSERKDFLFIYLETLKDNFNQMQVRVSLMQVYQIESESTDDMLIVAR